MTFIWQNCRFQPLYDAYYGSSRAKCMFKPRIKTQIICFKTFFFNMHDPFPPKWRLNKVHCVRMCMCDTHIVCLIQKTVFAQLCVKVPKLWMEKFEYFFESHGTSYFWFMSHFRCRFWWLSSNSKIQTFRFHRNKGWIGPMNDIYST